ncbi:MAG: esterase family protein [Alistipes sp.]|nr:esterase family protein [Alistipes sp.]
MRKITTLIALILASVIAVQAQSQLKRVTIKSKILGAKKTYSIYLPDGYEKTGERYPVLYLLHGANGSHESWCRDGGGEQPRITDEEIAAGRAKKMIVVMPDAGGLGKKNGGKNMGYFNVEGWAYEDFFFQEFIPHIDQTYRTIASKEGRAVAGLSMGGGGAFVYAQRHPEMFNAAYSTSGLLDHRFRAKIASSDMIPFYWSVAQTSPVEFVRNTTPQKIEALRSVRWMMDCGDDDRIIFTNIDLFLEMKRRRVPVEFRVRDGKHNWHFWRKSLPEILQFSFR